MDSLGVLPRLHLGLKASKGAVSTGPYTVKFLSEPEPITSKDFAGKPGMSWVPAFAFARTTTRASKPAGVPCGVQAAVRPLLVTKRAMSSANTRSESSCGA